MNKKRQKFNNSETKPKHKKHPSDIQLLPSDHRKLHQQKRSHNIDSLTEVPTKELLIKAGYKEKDLKNGIDYLANKSR